MTDITRRLFISGAAALMMSSGLSAQTIPLDGYNVPLETDRAPVTTPAYTYNAWVHGIYDADTWQISVDAGFRMSYWTGLRAYGVNAYEITRKRGVTSEDVQKGYDCRDLMVRELGSDEIFPRKAKYHNFAQPIPIVVESIKADKYGGRWLFVAHKDGRNLNNIIARSGCAYVTKYDRKTYAVDTDITPDF